MLQLVIASQVPFRFATLKCVEYYCEYVIQYYAILYMHKDIADTSYMHIQEKLTQGTRYFANARVEQYIRNATTGNKHP
jgi:hypothetical protein